MKTKVTLIAFIYLLPFRGVSQEKLAGLFQVKVHIPASKITNKVYLSYKDSAGNAVKDSSSIKSGIAFFKGYLTQPKHAQLDITHMRVSKETNSWMLQFNPNNVVGYTDFYLEPGLIEINAANDSLADAVIKGGIINSEFQEFVEQKEAYYDQIRNLNKLLIGKGSMEKARQKIILDSIDLLYKNLPEKVYKTFFLLHTQSYIGLKSLIDYSLKADPDSLQMLFKQVPEKLKTTDLGKYLSNRISVLKSTMIGRTALDFIQPDSAGKQISLLSFRGKYLLIDFWASWCAPCRNETPNLLNAFRRFKDFNFTILSVSIDNNKKKWLEAVNADHLPWSQVSDLKTLNSAAEAYQVVSIPQNYLVDPNGKIIAKDLRGAALEEELEHIFGKKDN